MHATRTVRVYVRFFRAPELEYGLCIYLDILDMFGPCGLRRVSRNVLGQLGNTLGNRRSAYRVASGTVTES